MASSLLFSKAKMDEYKTNTLSCRLEAIDEDSPRTITDALEIWGKEARAIHRLLADPEENLKLLDLPKFQKAILKHAIPQRVARALCQSSTETLASRLENRKTAVYLSRVWLNYRLNGILPEISEHQRNMVETVDILGELAQVKGYEKFELLAMSGELLPSSSWPSSKTISMSSKRTQKLSASYYEAFARISYRAARDHGLSNEFGLTEVCADLADNFSKFRVALSELRPETSATVAR